MRSVGGESRWRGLLRDHRGVLPTAGLCAALVVVLFWTVPHYGFHCDEPIYEMATRRIEQWMQQPWSGVFSAESIERFWKVYPEFNVHPSGLKWLNVLAHRIWGGSVPETLHQDRFMVILFFSLSLAIFLRTLFPDRTHYLFVVPLLLLSQPRFFAQAHFAVTEMPMIGGLLLVWAAWLRFFHTPWFWLLCPLLGFFWSVKLTCWILTGVMVVLLTATGDTPWRKVVPRLALVLAGAVLVFYLLNPDYWFDPFGRLSEFLHQSLTRSQWTPISLQYFGEIYLQRGPWPYPFVMLGITTPLLHLALLLAGLALTPWWRRPDRRKSLPVVVMGFFMVFFMLLPVSPMHDSERYLLPGFPFLAVIMAWGAERLYRFCREHRAGLWGRALTIALVAALCVGVFRVGSAFGTYHPHELSYYNEIVGGVRGAERKGLEVSYLMDVVGPGLIERLNNDCAGRGVYFVFPYQPLLMVMLHEEGRLRFLPTLEPKGIHFVAVYGRPSIRFWMEHLPRTIPPGLGLELLWQECVDGVPIFRLYGIRRTEVAVLSTRTDSSETNQSSKRFGTLERKSARVDKIAKSA